MMNQPIPPDNEPETAPAMQARAGMTGGSLVVLALILGFGIHLSWMLSEKEKLDSLTDAAREMLAPMHDPASRSGWDRDVRVRLLDTNWDVYLWVHHAQNAAHEGSWRVRWCDLDNAPNGREMHWSQSLIWLLMIAGSFHSLVSGLPQGAAIEAVAPWVLPIMLVLITIASVLFLRRHLGDQGAAAFAFLLPGCAVFSDSMAFGQVDHHGLAGFAILFSLLFLAMAFRPDAASKREVWAASSGLAGAAGLWISASSVIPFLAGAGLGLLGAGLAGARPSGGGNRATFDARSIRLWGTAGCAGAIGFYLVEYFPSHMGMRLEVNHPFYAVAWMAGAWLVAILVEWRGGGPPPWAPARRLAVTAVMALLALLPVLAITLGGSSSFAPADEFLLAIHNSEIAEFNPIFDQNLSDPLWFVLMKNANWLACPAAGLLLASRFGKRRDEAGMAFLLGIPLLVLTLLAISQIRWLITANAAAIAVIAVSMSRIPLFEKGAVGKCGRLCQAALVIAFISLLSFGLWRSAVGFAKRSSQNLPVGLRDEYAFSLARTAHLIAERMPPGKRPRILCEPNASPALAYFSGGSAVGSFYWENIEGLKAAEAMFLATDEDSLKARLLDRGITHIVLTIVTRDKLLTHGQTGAARADGKPEEPAFLKKALDDRSLPRWLSPVALKREKFPKHEFSIVLEFRPEQSEAEALVARGVANLVLGNIAQARERFQAALASDPACALARLRLAALEPDANRSLQAIREAAKVCSPENFVRATMVLLSEDGYPRSAFSHALIGAALEAAPGHPALLAESVIAALANPSPNSMDVAVAKELLAGVEPPSGPGWMRWRLAEALLLAREGDLATAQRFFVEAFSFARREDLPVKDRRQAAMLLAMVLGNAGEGTAEKSSN